MSFLPTSSQSPPSLSAQPLLPTQLCNHGFFMCLMDPDAWVPFLGYLSCPNYRKSCHLVSFTCQSFKTALAGEYKFISLLLYQPSKNEQDKVYRISHPTSPWEASDRWEVWGFPCFLSLFEDLHYILVPTVACFSFLCHMICS